MPNTSSGLERFADPEDHAETEAQSTLELALPLLEEAAGAEVDRHGRRAEPLDAIQDAVNLHGFDEIILSTLPKRVSRWLHLDLPPSSPASACRSRPSPPRARGASAASASAPSLGA